MRTLLALTLSLFVALTACGEGTTQTTDAGTDTAEPSETTSPTVESVTTAAPGDDEPLGGGSYPIGELTISWGTPNDEEQTYTISCLGDTATLSGDWDQSTDTIGDIAADKMCTRLADPAVIERLTNGVPADRVCTELYGSDHSARVVGTLNGNEVSTDFHRTNGCGIDDWDSLMASILPAVA